MAILLKSKSGERMNLLVKLTNKLDPIRSKDKVRWKHLSHIKMGLVIANFLLLLSFHIYYLYQSSIFSDLLSFQMYYLNRSCIFFRYSIQSDLVPFQIQKLFSSRIFSDLVSSQIYYLFRSSLFSDLLFFRFIIFQIYFLR